MSDGMVRQAGQLRASGPGGLHKGATERRAELAGTPARSGGWSEPWTAASQSENGV